MRDVLKEYNLESDSIEAIPLFIPPSCEIRDDDKYFEECITEINKRLRDYGTLRPDSLETMRNEYVASILHTALHIVGDDTKKNLSMRPQHEIIGEKSSGRVDFAIKDSEDLICITDDKQHKVPMGFAQNIKQLESSYETNKRK